MPTKENLLIAVDAGHGGSDPGAVDDVDLKEDDGIYADEIYSEESDLNLKGAKVLSKILKEKGYQVLMTRNEDKYVSLAQRTKIANYKKADLFISIHANAAGSESANGYETLYYPTSKGGKKLAESIQENVIKKLKPRDRGTKKRKNLYVLRKTHMPAVLLEMGFITNIEEEKKLNDEDYLYQMMEAVAEGIEEYLA